MQVNFKCVPLGYTLVGDSNPVPLGSIIEFWDIPDSVTTLIGLPWYTGR